MARKATVADSVIQGAISFAEAAAMFDVSPEELYIWLKRRNGTCR